MKMTVIVNLLKETWCHGKSEEQKVVERFKAKAMYHTTEESTTEHQHMWKKSLF